MIGKRASRASSAAAHAGRPGPVRQRLRGLWCRPNRTSPVQRCLRLFFFYMQQAAAMIGINGNYYIVIPIRHQQWQCRVLAPKYHMRRGVSVVLLRRFSFLCNRQAKIKVMNMYRFPRGTTTTSCFLLLVHHRAPLPRCCARGSLGRA